MKTGLLTVAFCASAALSALSVSAGTARFAGGSVYVSPDENLSNITLTISGPDGFYVQTSKAFGTPIVSLYENGAIADGQYSWELTGSTSEQLPIRVNKLNDGRGEAAASRVRYKGASESGAFRIVGGVMLNPDLEEKE